MLRRFVQAFTILMAAQASAEILPGFALEQIVAPNGFLTSIAFDDNEVLHFTTADGGIWRYDNHEQLEIGRVVTAVGGNAALLGMAFASDGTIIVHYVAEDMSADVISRIDPATGAETVLARLTCPFGDACPTEHHGGNPAVADDGSIYVAVGDWGLLHLAQRDDLDTAKIFRIDPDGIVTTYAKGFRNPFDLSWDPTWERIIASDNGIAVGDDELVFVREGENHGWPLTMGHMPPLEGMTPPVYVFPERTAPTGLMITDSDTGWFRKGVLVTSFVTRALYYFPDYDETSVVPPVEILRDETTALIDVRQTVDGEVYLASAFAIYRLAVPLPGDVNGDGEVDRSDHDALVEELADASGGLTALAQEGTHRASWGADVDQNGIIDEDDLALLSRMLTERRRPTRHRSGTDRRRPLSGRTAD